MLSPEQFLLAKRLFHEAEALTPPERESFLSSSCHGEPEVRAEVERLLAEETRETVIEGMRRDVAEALGGASGPAAVGDVVSHYNLTRRLGAGGMGEVFQAEDLALGRTAAVKLLRPGVGEALRARLGREARAAARLEHPAIATFYETGQTDGAGFIAMEYVPGETLRERLGRGPMPAQEALGMTIHLLEGLVHAHALGVLHRDIKPENIVLLPDGRPKLLDFGIAKLAGDEPIPVEKEERPTQTVLTRHGSILGTIGYMSPEQLRGDPVDVRTDLFALGAVLYEAVAGRPAFPGDTARERFAAILTKDPAPVAADDLPPDFPEILKRALARERDERYADAAAFLRDLRRIAGGEAVTELASTLAVLDLENLSRRPDDDWIGSGVAESLGADLSRVEGLGVLAREKVLGTARAMAGEDERPDPVAVGRALGCRWVLAGGFQQMGGALRLTVRVLDAATGDVVVTEKVDGKSDELFEMQDRIAEAVTSGLDLETAEHHAAPQLDAFECYARGRQLFQRMEKGSFDQGRELLERAIELDPDYADALGVLTSIHCMRFAFTTDPEELRKAEAYGRRAVAADPDAVWARVWLGYSIWRQGRQDEALTVEEEASRRDAESGFADYFRSAILSEMGRNAEALPLLQDAAGKKVGSGDAWFWRLLAWLHIELGNQREALWAGKRALELHAAAGGNTQAPTATDFWAEILRRTGRHEEAHAACLRALEEMDQSDHPFRELVRIGTLNTLGRLFLGTGEHDRALAAYTQAEGLAKGRRRGLGVGHALVQALAGQTRAGAGPGPFEEALALFEDRREHDFSWGAISTDSVSLAELARAARALGRDAQARSLYDRAIAAGSIEARAEIDG